MKDVTCPDCTKVGDACICAAVDQFFKDNAHLMDQLAENDTAEDAEARAEESGASRCLACFFFACRCSTGHAGRLE